MDELRQLSELLRERNAIDQQIASLIGRPATTGHIGEFIAARIFDITLEVSASTKGIDGQFSSGPLRGRTVDIKYYTKLENILDLPGEAVHTPGIHPDYYLVLTGTKAKLLSRGTHRAHVIEYIFLFEAVRLIGELNERAGRRGRIVKFGIATSVPMEFWQRAEIYPEQHNSELVLTNLSFVQNNGNVR